MCNIFFVTFGFYGKKCRILLQEFDKFVRAAFDPYGRSFWRKTTSRKNIVFHISLGLRGENILIRHNLVCSLLTRLSFLTLEHHFEISFQQFRIFSSISGFQYELLPFLAQKFRHSRQKCILRVQTKVWWKIGFRLEKVRIFHKHLDSTQKMSDFWWKISARSPGLHFSYTRARFEKIFWVSRAKIWVFLNNFYPLILFEIRAGIVETFYAKILAHLLKLPSTSTDKQSEEKPSFRKNLVLHIFSWLGGEKFD